VIDSLNNLSTLLVGMQGEWEGMQAAWTALPNSGGRRGQTQRAAARPDPASGGAYRLADGG